jgi:hypothetical protein
MRPTPAFLIAGVLGSLLAAGTTQAAGLALHASAVPTATTASTGTTSASSTGTTATTGTTTGTTTATTGATTTTDAAVPSRLTGALLPTAPVPVAPATGTSSNGSAISSSTTTFNNGARYVVNADGTVTVLGNVASTTSTSGNTLSTNTNGTTSSNPLLSDVLGTSPGQTSTGTAAGNSSAGIVDTGAVLSNGFTPGTLAPGVIVGGVATSGGVVGNIDYGAMADAGSGVNANGERVASIGGVGSSTPVPFEATARTPTPTYDLATRAATARDLNRRARGETPRVYGIAPRTNNDRTDQMPDDPVIRY